MICSFKKLIYPKTVQEAESGSYMVALYGVHDHVPDAGGNRLREVKIVGYYLPMTNGLRYEIEGQWVKNKYGMQVKMESFTELIRPDHEGIVAYLSSGLIKGVGKKIAERI